MTRAVPTSNLAWVMLLTTLLSTTHPGSASAASAADIDRDSAAQLRALYARQPSAKILGQKAKGILVFPKMLKAGFMFGGQIGEGALRKNGRVAGYYNSVAASYGFQAGVQKFGYALFFMSDRALDQLDTTRGFELGVGPSLVVVDEGIGRSITSNTITSDVYAYVFNQSGLMAGAGIQGSKITRIEK